MLAYRISKPADLALDKKVLEKARDAVERFPPSAGDAILANANIKMVVGKGEKEG